MHVFSADRKLIPAQVQENLVNVRVEAAQIILHVGSPRFEILLVTLELAHSHVLWVQQITFVVLVTAVMIDALLNGEYLDIKCNAKVQIGFPYLLNLRF